MGPPLEPLAPALLHREGSKGNGGAMRVAPVGAYFADDLDALHFHARASAQVTHAHVEGQAGALAVALAAAFAWRRKHAPETLTERSLLSFVEAQVPPGGPQ